jgi:LysM repeat protein
MRKYNALYRPALLLLAGATLLGGCAGTPEAPPPSAPPPPVASPAPEPLPPEETPAEPVRVKQDAPLRYVVKRGDTLWDIANQFLLDPWQWPEIWVVNEQVANPHLIYPGDILVLAWRDGRPRLERAADGGLRVERELYTYTGPVESRSPQVRSEPLVAPIPVIPVEAVRDFLSSPRLITAEQLRGAPYVLAFGEDQLVAGANSRVYIKNLPQTERRNYALVRRGPALRDPESGEILGYEALAIGEVEVRQLGQPAIGVLTRTAREARAGDQLIEIETDIFDSNFYPRAPQRPINGRVIAVQDGLTQVSQYQIVTLNRGSRHGLEPGHLLTAFEPGRLVRDPGSSTDARVRLPDVPTATLMIFKVTPRISYGLILTSTRPVHRLDRVEKPSRS